MNTKMKVLSLALVGAFGYVGAASAACPTDPAQSGGGAWSAKNVANDASLTIQTPGLASTECKLNVSVNANALANTRAFVTDESPNDEPRYRARFYLNTSALAGLTLANQQTKIFNASAANSPGAGISTAQITVSLLGSSSGPAVRLLISDASQPSKFKTFTTVLPASASKTYTVEVDLTQGNTANNFKYWVAAVEDAAPVEATPTNQGQVDTTGWSGVTSVNLGLFSTTAGFRANVAGQALSLDQFDSRRQTFIGR